MNFSRLLQLPQDIFRVIFQYLSVEDLMKGEEAFLNNQELLSLYRSSLNGFPVKEEIKIDNETSEPIINFIIFHNLNVEFLSFQGGNVLLLQQFRSSIKVLTLKHLGSSFDFPLLGCFPRLITIKFSLFNCVSNDNLLSFFSLHPQLENVEFHEIKEGINEILPHLSNYCPKIKFLSLATNQCVNDGTIAIITQGFPNLKSLNVRRTLVKNENFLRQFILSHPSLSDLSFSMIQYYLTQNSYSNDFLLFYLNQVIFPSILNHHDLQSHSYAISSLLSCLDDWMYYECKQIVKPHVFSVTILTHLYHKHCSIKTLHNTIKIFFLLSKVSSMIPLIQESQFISILLNHLTPHGLPPDDHSIGLLFHCYHFQEIFPILVHKYETQSSSLIILYRKSFQNHFRYLTTKDFNHLLAIVFQELQFSSLSNTSPAQIDCLNILLKLLQEPITQDLLNPNDLVQVFQTMTSSSPPSSSSLSSSPHLNHINIIFECLLTLLLIDEDYQPLIIQSNLFPSLLPYGDSFGLMKFLKHSLSSSQFEPLVDHLIRSGLVQILIQTYHTTRQILRDQIESLLVLLISFKNNKYSDLVRGEMELSSTLKGRLFPNEKIRG